MARRQPSFFLRFLCVVLLAALAVYFSRDWWLRGLAYALIKDEGPEKADLAVVLAGDYWGNRILKAGELVRQGYVPAVLVSGPPGFYGLQECEPAIAYAVRQGYPGNWFIPFPDHARSTKEESGEILAELARRQVHRFLIVTSDYHTARAGRIFRGTEHRMGESIPFRVVAAPDAEFHPDSWWLDRQGQKIAFMEWTKTFATALGI